MLRLVLVCACLLACGARADDHGEDDDPAAAVTTGALAGTVVGAIGGTIAASAWWLSGDAPKPVDGQVGLAVITASTAGGAALGAALGGVRAGRADLAAAGALGAGLGAVVPAAAYGTSLVVISEVTGWGIIAAPALAIFFSVPALKLTLGTSYVGATVGACAIGACGHLRGLVGANPEDDNATFAARLAPVAVEVGAATGLAVGGLWALATTTTNATPPTAPTNASNAASPSPLVLGTIAVGAPMLGALGGGLLGGAVAGDIGVGASAGVGGMVGVGVSAGTVAGVVGVARLSEALIAPDAHALVRLSPLVPIGLLVGVGLVAPYGGAALAVCATHPGVCTMFAAPHREPI